MRTPELDFTPRAGSKLLVIVVNENHLKMFDIMASI